METLQRPQIICHVQKNLNYTIHDVKWIPCSAKFVSIGGKSNGAGVIETYSLDAEGSKKCRNLVKKSTSNVALSVLLA
jgi:hypothetical protein